MRFNFHRVYILWLVHYHVFCTIKFGGAGPGIRVLNYSQIIEGSATFSKSGAKHPIWGP